MTLLELFLSLMFGITLAGVIAEYGSAENRNNRELRKLVKKPLRRSITDPRVWRTKIGQRVEAELYARFQKHPTLRFFLRGGNRHRQ
jgi:hypothetical protein